MATHWFEGGEGSARSLIIGLDSASMEEMLLIENGSFSSIVVLEIRIIGIDNKDSESLIKLNKL